MLRLLIVGTIVSAVSVGYGQKADQQLEFIESTSPLQGGAVVTSVYYPDQTNSTNSPTNLQNEFAKLQKHSVLQQPVPEASQPNAAPQSGQNLQQGVAFQPIVPFQIPSLGVPTRWNTALRPPPRLRYKTPLIPLTTLSPVLPSGSTAASMPPALPQSTAATMTPTTRTSFSPMIQVQNMPPNAYAGRGIVGSPKLYVDGQPVRNLLRYLIIP